MSPKITYKYIDGQWKKHHKVYDYLGSLRFTIGADKALLNYKQYEPYGETMLDTFGLTRQSYIGKEKEPENNLLYLIFTVAPYGSLSEILNPLFRGTLK